MHQQDPSAGTIIAERYKLIETLGQGGVGCVWRAEHLALGSEVAIKLLNEDVSERQDIHERFMREAQSAARLSSLHVVQIFDYGVDDGHPYIAMELLKGESLRDRLNRMVTLSPLETLRVLSHCCRAIDKAHQLGIVHRDLKPENIFIVAHEEEVVKVLDFGIAKVTTTELDSSNRTRTGMLLGTPYYMSTEQAQGNRSVDERSDLWSLGVIAYECLLGKLPFYSDALGALVMQICMDPLPVPSEHGQVPAGFDAWFQKTVARNADERFQNVREFITTLAEVLGGDARLSEGTFIPMGEGPDSRRPSLSPPTTRETSTEQAGALSLEAPVERPSKTPLLVAAMSSVLLLCSLAFVVYWIGGAQPSTTGGDRDAKPNDNSLKASQPEPADVPLEGDLWVEAPAVEPEEMQASEAEIPPQGFPGTNETGEPVEAAPAPAAKVARPKATPRASSSTTPPVRPSTHRAPRPQKPPAKESTDLFSDIQ